VELEAQRLRQELAHIGRVSAMGELTASLAHELNQPLTAILNNAQVAQRFLAAEVVDVAEMREILNDIVADDKRAADVIRRLRLLLKKGDLEYVSLDLNEVVTEVARLVMSDAAIRNVPMRLETAAGLPRVRGDRVQLQQVVLNLVLNGLDAMREPGAREGGLVIRTLSDGAGLVAVAVQDAGPGIADKDADHIFNALYTTKSEGIGMGLAIVRTIVDAHGGRITAENNPDGGATFQFTLPAEKATGR
jgi:two-component system, LuxR family, sensor kinase FixL